MLPGRNILIFHLGALGDFIVTWPLAVALGRLYPQSRIIYVTHGQKGKLAERVLGVESRDIESGKWHDLFGDARALPEASLRTLAGAQKIFSFVGAGSKSTEKTGDFGSHEGDRWIDNVRPLAPRADVFSIEPRPTGPWADHVSRFIQEQLKPDPAIAASVDQILKSTIDRGLGRGQRGGGGVVIHPGAGSFEKRWPAERFVELATLLSTIGMKARFVIGEAEAERFDAKILRALKSAAPVEQPVDFIALHALVQSADVFVGNDTGPSHLAGIIGVPTVALFGPASDPALWKPLGPSVFVIESKRLETITVASVYEQVTRAYQPVTTTVPVPED